VSEDPIISLQSRITHLERHLEQQDAEHYHMAKKLEQLTQLVRQQEEKIKSFSDSSGSMPADEKPPHY
jgi:uncharacterized coiled-coil protein SlyX